MKRTFLKNTSVFLMLLCCSVVFANGVTESAPATESKTNTKVNSILDDYIEDLAEYNSNYEIFYTQMQMAYNKNDADAYLEAKKNLKSLEIPKLTEEDSKTIENQIVEANDLESAKLLYQYSRYYRPSVTLVSKEEGFSYKSSFMVNPGSDVTLPILKTPKRSMLFKGWGTEDGVVVYEGGETIQMPISSTTLYAVFEADPSLVTGKSIDISYNEEALNLPQSTITTFSSIVKNNGTEDLNNVEVFFESDDPLLVILTGKLTSRYIESCGERIANFQVITKASMGTQLSGVITVKDSNGNTWSKDVTFIVK